MIKDFLLRKIKQLFIHVNEKNSTSVVQCIAIDKCKFRFTTMCEMCKKNIGAKEEKSYYEER